MRWLSVMRLARLTRSNVERQLSRDNRGCESGAIAAIVGIFLGSFVLLGVGALVIDTGSLLYERRQLQSGADAAALSIAEACAKAPTSAPCANPDISSASTLVTLAGANAADQKSDIASVCGSAALVAANPAAFPTECTNWLATPAPPDPGLVECPKTTFNGNYVEVRTKTRTGDDQTVLPPVLSQMLAGANAQYSNTTVKACARAAWGPAESVPEIFPVTFSECEYATNKDFKTDPPKGPGLGYGVTGNADGNTPWPAADKQVLLKTAKKTANCTGWNGHVAPGSFGAVDNVKCAAKADKGWVEGNEGNPIPCNDSDLVKKVGTIVYIPIFGCFTSTKDSFANCADGKNHAWFHMTGYAPFYLTGFYFSGSGSEGNSIFPPDLGAKPCNGSDRCISGWFTTDTLPTSIDTSGAPSFGSIAVQLTG